MHTDGDPLVPFRHQALYGEKTSAVGSPDAYARIPISRYGHCSFAPEEVLGAFFGLLLLR
jgi:hypothetical protein